MGDVSAAMLVEVLNRYGCPIRTLLAARVLVDSGLSPRRFASIDLLFSRSHVVFLPRNERASRLFSVLHSCSSRYLQFLHEFDDIWAQDADTSKHRWRLLARYLLATVDKCSFGVWISRRGHVRFRTKDHLANKGGAPVASG